MINVIIGPAAVAAVLAVAAAAAATLHVVRGHDYNVSQPIQSVTIQPLP